MSTISSSFADRPPPDPHLLLASFDAWQRGDDTAGTALQSLKRGGLDLLLADANTGPTSSIDAMRSAWDAWERGHSPPAEALARLEEAGLRALLEAGVAP